MLEGGEGASRVGREGQRHRDAQHPGGQPSARRRVRVMPPPVEEIDQRHQNETQDIRRHAPKGDGGAAFFDIPGGNLAQKKRHQKNSAELLNEMDQRGLPHPPAGGEIARHGGAQGDAGHAHRREAKGAHCARVPDPEKTDGLGQLPENDRRGSAEKGPIGKTAPHRLSHAAVPLKPQLLGHEARGGKADAGDGKGGAEPRHRENELI